jgi:pimeloyl-ACP methyl ester carboxylesterase
MPGRSVADAAADVAAILDVLGIDAFTTVGWSGGGPHALACAALLAERCTATAVVAGLAPPECSRRRRVPR